jgi:hypothetical protein
MLPGASNQRDEGRQADREGKEDQERSRMMRDQVKEEEASHVTRCKWREEERTEGKVEIDRGTKSEQKHDGNRQMQVVRNWKNGQGTGRTKVKDAKKSEQGQLR